jgi:hypothetical protein
MPTTEAKRAYNAAYYAKHKDKESARHATWQHANKDHVNAYRRAWRAKRREAAKAAKIAARKAKFAKADADYGVLAEAQKMTANAAECKSAI